MQNQTPIKTPTAVIAGILWLVTAVLSVICILTSRQIMIRILARFGLPHLVPIGNWTVTILMTIFGIAVIIGGFEYHFRRYGSEESWRLFSYTLSAEIGILLLGLFV